MVPWHTNKNIKMIRSWRRDYVNDDNEDKSCVNFPLIEVSKFSSPSLYINFKPDKKKWRKLLVRGENQNIWRKTSSIWLACEWASRTRHPETRSSRLGIPVRRPGAEWRANKFKLIFDSERGNGTQDTMLEEIAITTSPILLEKDFAAERSRG